MIDAELSVPYQFIISWLTPTPHPTAVYASCSASQPLRNWIAAEREFLAWRAGLEAARRAWQATPDSLKIDALLMGAGLTQAQSWLEKRRDDLPVVDRGFIDQSAKRESKVGEHLRSCRRFLTAKVRMI